MQKNDLVKQINLYLSGGGLFNPELANHVEVRNLLIECREVLAQPEFTKHEVENADDWSDWVCPDPKSYLMKCCDCGLVHEAQFKVVRYKSDAEHEDCDPVDDPNVQAVFRMRRSEQWTPKDTAYRPGGLAQPEAKDTIQSVDSSTERKAD